MTPIGGGRRFLVIGEPDSTTQQAVADALAQAPETGAVVVVDAAFARQSRFRAAMDKLHAVEDDDDAVWDAARHDLERVIAENNAEEDAAARLLAVTYDGPRRPPPGRPGCPRCDGSGTATRTATGQRVPGHRCPVCRKREVNGG